jgi:hypothetical protein
MKKLFYLLSLLIITQLKAQSPQIWDSVAIGGFGLGSNYAFETAMDTFQGKLFAGLSDNFGGFAKIVYSSDGLLNSFTEETGFTSINNINGNQYIRCMRSAAGYLYAAVSNYSGTSASVFFFDGNNWNNAGSLPLGNYAAIEQQEIKHIEFFQGNFYFFISSSSTTFGFRIISCAPGAINGWNIIHEAPSLNDDGSWIKSTCIFNNKIYFASSGNVNKFFEYDGVSVTINSAGPTTILANPNNYEMTALGVFNNEMYVGTYNNGTGAEIFKTADGNSYVQVLSGGFTSGIDVYAINKITEYNNELWVAATGNGYGVINRNSNSATVQGGSAIAVIYHSPDGINYFRSNTPGYGDINSFANSSNLIGFKNRLYHGYDMTAGGSMWKHCYTPVANFTMNPNDSTCRYSLVSCNFTGSGANEIQWYDDATNTGTGTTHNTSFNTVGTHTLSVYAENSSPACAANFSQTIYIAPEISLSIIQNPAANICPGQPVSVSMSWTGGVGTSYTYNWSSGGVYPSFTTQSFSVTGISTGGFTPSLISNKGCSASDFHLISVDPATALTGTVTANTAGIISAGDVYLFKYQPGNAYLDTVGSVALNASGVYQFNNLDYGTYLIKAHPNTGSFPNTIPTYFDSIYVSWATAKTKFHGCSQLDTANIRVIEVLPSLGPGLVTGRITEDAGYGNRINGVMQPGDPIPGIDIKLGKKPGGSAQARTTTNSNGDYSFPNVPLGDYYIYVDIPNIGQDSTREVSLTSGNPTSPNNDYKVDSIKIFVDSTAVGIAYALNSAPNGIKAYPVPSIGDVSFEYFLTENEEISISIFDLNGKKVCVLFEGKQNAGSYILKMNSSTFKLEAGNYLFNLNRKSGKTESVRFILQE